MLSALEELIAYVNSLELSAYTSASAQPVIQDLARAKAMLANEEVTQEEVNDMADALQASVDNLVEVNNSTNAEESTNTAAAMQTGMFAGLLALTGGMLAVARRKRETDLDLKADVLMSVCLYLIGGRNKALCEFYLKICTMCHSFVFILCFLCGKRFRILLKLPCKGNTSFWHSWERSGETFE